MPCVRVLAACLLASCLLAGRSEAASAVLFDLNGSASAAPLAFAEDKVAWTITPAQSMLLDGLSTTFGRLPGSTALGTVLPRSVRIALHEGTAQGALKAQLSVFVDALGGAKGGNVEPVLLLGGKPYVLTLENVRNIGATVVDGQVQQPRVTTYLPHWLSGAGFATLNPTFGNGTAQPLGAPILRWSGAPVTVLPQVDCLMTWAETTYPGFFAPRTASANTLYTFYYRHYPQTGTYLGISAADDNVYVMEGNGIITNVGALANWLTLSRCQAKR